ncbi:MAG: histidine phosphatase family protein [Rhodomicrobiaceae bacterium]
MLILFRHAKSSWDFPELEDFDRPLSNRGQKAAPRMAAWLAETGLIPDHIICSASRRTRQTLDLALPFWKPTPTIDYAEALYHASPETLLTIAHDAPHAARDVMIVGHNPGLEAFATRMIGSGDKKTRLALASKFPTAAVAVITFETDSWAKIALASGHLAHFITPKQLKRD